ncbi:phosphoribosylformylglycinamidine synthase [Shimia aestuarii]|uniref:Phosphoribosylformylglycinamidine synthase subunit PurS n=2 Tax=Shimia aestuarii TaxID=254406 RepID=A0A1I4NKK9_9RHOB|nr:phosphoribosylformylglycinamidine synthase [Shimia aestuarii]
MVRDGIEYFGKMKTPWNGAFHSEKKNMKARVYVMLKNGVLDPQGEAVRHALGSLGFDGVEGVRQGKVIELDLADGTTEATVTEMCEKLLANTVIESYRVEMG